MYFYEGYKCPVCDKPFADGDDIVVCPQCGLPHHRACWAEDGHCRLRHLHGTAEQWERNKANATSTESSETKTNMREDRPTDQVCPRCRTRNPQYAEFCQHCGAQLNNTNAWSDSGNSKTSYNEYQPFKTDSYEHANDGNEDVGGVSEKDLSAFVGQRANYYLPRFRRMARSGKNVSWNWAAFIFGPLWLLYRKMYTLGAVVILLELVQSVIAEIVFNAIGFRMTDDMSYSEWYVALESALMSSENLYFFISLWLISAIVFVLSIGLALYGNRLYRDHCYKTISRLRDKTPDLTAGELAASGGVSIAVTIIGYIAQYFLTQIIFIFI